MSKPQTLVELFTDPKRWTTLAMARDKNGSPVHETSPDACCWCLLGGMNYVYPMQTDAAKTVRGKLQDVLIKSRQPSSITSFNDFHSPSEVLDLCKKAGV